MSSSAFVCISDMVESNGKTIRENNLELRHTIPIGALVETYKRERLYVASHDRDCDGSPTYGLCMHDDLRRDFRIIEDRLQSSFVGGYDDDVLTVVDEVPAPVEYE